MYIYINIYVYTCIYRYAHVLYTQILAVSFVHYLFILFSHIYIYIYILCHSFTFHLQYTHAFECIPICFWMVMIFTIQMAMFGLC